jgi:hypothetical protein
MSESHTTLGRHLSEVTVTQLVGNVPPDTENNDRAVEVAATKEREGELAHAVDYQPALAFAPEP